LLLFPQFQAGKFLFSPPLFAFQVSKSEKSEGGRDEEILSEEELASQSVGGGISAINGGRWAKRLSILIHRQPVSKRVGAHAHQSGKAGLHSAFPSQAQAQAQAQAQTGARAVPTPDRGARFARQ